MSRIENRPLTKPSDPHRFADLGQVIAAIALLIIPAFLYATERAELHDATKHISGLEARLLQLRDERELLLVERATELDPRRLRDKARTLAGLVDPERGQMADLPRETNPPRLGGRTHDVWRRMIAEQLQQPVCQGRLAAASLAQNQYHSWRDQHLPPAGVYLLLSNWHSRSLRRHVLAC